MGYTTHFTGEFRVDPPLKPRHWEYLQFRHILRGVPDEDGTAIRWDGSEKFYEYIKWMEYLLENFLTPWGYTVNGAVEWTGENNQDIGRITVKNSKLTVARARPVYLDKESAMEFITQVLKQETPDATPFELHERAATILKERAAEIRRNGG